MKDSPADITAGAAEADMIINNLQQIEKDAGRHPSFKEKDK